MQGLLRRDRIGRAASCCIPAQLLGRLIVAQASGFWKILPMPVFGPMTPEVAQAWDFLAGWSYLPFSARMGALSMGVITAIAVSDATSRQQIGRQARTSLVCGVKTVQAVLVSQAPASDLGCGSRSARRHAHMSISERTRQECVFRASAWQGAPLVQVAAAAHSADAAGSRPCLWWLLPVQDRSCARAGPPSG